MAAKTDPARLDHAVELYLAGKSAYEIKSTLGVDRGALKRELIDRGIEPRGRSQAGKVRASKMSPEEREAQAAAAHAAARGRRHTLQERFARARARELHPPEMSDSETKVALRLTLRQVPFRREAAVGPYNVDFTVGALAVEILGGEWHTGKDALHAERTPEILRAGWAMCFVWDTLNCPLLAGAIDEVVAFANEVSRNPSLRGEYRVLRGDGHLIASGRVEDDDFTGVPPARHGSNPYAVNH